MDEEGTTEPATEYILSLNQYSSQHLLRLTRHRLSSSISMAQPQLKLPSDRTIAFAAAVISSKPADLTVRGK